jgi:hypothetical protein
LFQHPIVPTKKTNSTSFNKVFATGYLAAYALALLLAYASLYPGIYASNVYCEKKVTMVSKYSSEGIFEIQAYNLDHKNLLRIIIMAGYNKNNNVRCFFFHGF